MGSSERVVVLGARANAARWTELLTRAGYRAQAENPETFDAPRITNGAGGVRAIVIDAELEEAQSLLAVMRLARVPTVLVTTSDAAKRIGEDPDALTRYVEWMVDAYANDETELLPALALAMEPFESNGECLHLTFRGSLPAAEVDFPFGTAFPLRRGAAVYIGRSRSTPLQLASPHVGRAHALVSALPGNEPRAVVCDLSSTNGTFVRGKRVIADYLSPGDELYVAGYRFVLEALTAYSA